MFVIFCVQFVEQSPTIMDLLLELLSGGLGKIVKTRDGHKSELPYSVKPQIKRFVDACMETDRGSDVANKAQEWMRQLENLGDLGWKSKETTIHQREETEALISDFLGEPSLEERTTTSLASDQKAFRDPEWAAVHDTLHLSSANIALAAAAQGASVVVQCISSSGAKFFPETPESAQRRNMFLVRFWLVQPPEDICGILRYSNHQKMTKGFDDDDLDGDDGTEYPNLTIFGGMQELSIWVSRVLGYKCKAIMAEEPACFLQLWDGAAKYAKSLSWEMPQNSRALNSRLKLGIVKSKQQADQPLQVIKLSQELQRVDKCLNGISRDIAGIVHDFYLMQDYSSDNILGNEELKMNLAMDFVLIAIAVEMLRQITYTDNNSLNQYALHLSTLKKGTGGIREMVPIALHEGIPLEALVWASSMLWGGSSLESHGSTSVTDDVIGIVAPHCVVMMDVLRDPLAFVQKGLEGKLLSVWRGAVPMIPREPRTNFVLSWVGAKHPVLEDQDLQPKSEDTPRNKVCGEVIFTLEPHIEDPTRGVLCAWYGGQLVSEINLRTVLSNVMLRPAKRPQDVIDNIITLGPVEMEVLHRDRRGLHKEKKPGSLRIVKIQPFDLLTMKQFSVPKNVVLYLNDLQHISWALLAAGCCPAKFTTIYRGTFHELDEDKIRACGREETRGNVILLVP
ncbi:hypothetical protein F5Y02DRAFT_417914 [Annulohypoxylon stygium]|nr:hypothetical protein F5Y02DRAFT_417914 [Annulohypoxylon stygium]